MRSRSSGRGGKGQAPGESGRADEEFGRAGDEAAQAGDESATAGDEAARAGDESATAGVEAVPWKSLDEGTPVRLPIESVLDLHSFLPREVESVVEEYLIEALAAGFTEVRIIHGRGIGTQREIVRAVLARTSFVVDFGDAPPEAGGWGATLAVLSSSR